MYVLILTKCVLFEVLFYNFGTANTRWQHRTAASLGLSKKKRKPAWLLIQTLVMSNRCGFVNCPRTFPFSLRLVAILAYPVFFPHGTVNIYEHTRSGPAAKKCVHPEKPFLCFFFFFYPTWNAISYGSIRANLFSGWHFTTCSRFFLLFFRGFSEQLRASYLRPLQLV